MDNNEGVVKMNLSYEARAELLEIVKKEIHEHWKDILYIDNKFKTEKLINDKEKYWLKRQAQAYDRKMILSYIKEELQLSL